ncbi:MAG: iron-containing alcohol dehydrogenase [Rhodospirillales bacterium]
MQAFTLPPSVPIAFGPGRLSEVGSLLSERIGAAQRVLMVADPFAADSALADRLAEALSQGGHESRLFSEIASDPKEAQIDAAAAAARSFQATAILAVGGGSAMDVGKLTAAVAADSAPTAAYALMARALPDRCLPVIALPTTAGTGAEVTQTCVFSLTDGTKVWAWGPQLFPRLALLDPEVTASLPPALTAATGIDALVHAIESMTNRNAHPLADPPALQAIALVRRWLPRAVAEGGDLEARGQLQIAACLAGAAIAVNGCAVAHGIGHALGTLGHVHHGRAVGLCLRVALPGNAAAAPERHALVAEAFGLERQGRGDADLAVALPAAYEAFLEAVGLETSLAGDGLGPKDLDALLAECQSPENRPMLDSTCRPLPPEVLEPLCRDLLTDAYSKSRVGGLANDEELRRETRT